MNIEQPCSPLLTCLFQLDHKLTEQRYNNIVNMFMLANSTLFMPSSTRPSQLAEDATGKKRDHDLEHVKPVLKTGLGQHTLLRLAYAIIDELFTQLR